MLDLTIAVAPFDGIVTNEPVREGETVVEGIQNTEGSTFMTLADMSVITAEVKVDETDIVNIQIGQPADVTVDALPGKVFKGHVTLVGDQALLRSTGMATSQSTTGTEEAKDFKVVVTLDKPSSDLRPGSPPPPRSPPPTRPTCSRCPSRRSPCTTPTTTRPKQGGVQAASALRLAKSAPVQGVYVVDKDKSGKLRAKFVPVTTGITGATDIEVLSGLNEGEEIVTGPYKTLRALKNNALVKRDTVKPRNDRRELISKPDARSGLLPPQWLSSVGTVAFHNPDRPKLSKSQQAKERFNGPVGPALTSDLMRDTTSVQSGPPAT